MRTTVSFRFTDHQLEILTMAEKIIQKPRCEIICAMIEKNLQQTLKELVAAGVRPREFHPNSRRFVHRKKACEDAQSHSG